MDLIEDEPRKHPKPVPFCQSSLPSSVVPDVSLILQDNFGDKPEKKNEAFAGTEFQTYNAWKWKHMKLNQQIINPESKSPGRCTDLQDCCLIKDKYAYSDIEKRKNEILYGHLDEPRRPLPPRAHQTIPKCTDSFFNNSSFEDLKWIDDRVKEKQPNTLVLENIPHKKTSKTSEKVENIKSSPDNSEKLFNIITEQSKQTLILQKQIEQLLKLQEVKDKQIEQLLKSQDSREKKIEQLLENLQVKDTEMEKLSRLKEKQEQQIQDLLRSQEKTQKENFDLVQKLNKHQRKEVNSVGVMTCVQVVEASTNTCGEGLLNDHPRKDQHIAVEDLSIIRNCNETNSFDPRDKSLSLHSTDLPVIPEHVPTPQSSIHLDIQDFHDSSDESETDSDALEICQTSSEAQTTPLGYTFYNNVLSQVKDIIQNSGEKEARNGKNEDLDVRECRSSKTLAENNYVVENRGKLQSFHAWGVNVFERENIPPINGNNEVNNHADRYYYDSPNICVQDTRAPSDISLRINALALKYLKQDQISQYNLQSQMPTSHQPDVTIYNVTNLSFGSMRYLDRYRILPGVKGSRPVDTNIQQNECSPTHMLRRKKKMNLQENLNSSIGNILDISTLNQQPKLM